MECLRHMWMCPGALSLGTTFAGAYATCTKAMYFCRLIGNFAVHDILSNK